MYYLSRTRRGRAGEDGFCEGVPDGLRNTLDQEWISRPNEKKKKTKKKRNYHGLDCRLYASLRHCRTEHSKESRDSLRRSEEEKENGQAMEKTKKT